MKKLIFVVGTRPNFIKLAPIIRVLNHTDVEYKIVHTGQHYDIRMSKIFFDELQIPNPDIHFQIDNISTSQQTAEIISKFEKYCLDESPDCVVVFGDVTSTLAAAIVTSQIKNTKLAHVEAGERSFDKTMPEELNRIVIDHLSDYLFCTNSIADINLQNEGISNEQRFIVGNTVIDNLIHFLPKLKQYRINNELPFVLFTLHRASNVDNKDTLKRILKGIDEVSNHIDVIIPLHPRTEKRINQFGLNKYTNNFKILPSLSYLDFITHLSKCSMIFTDSGGIQNESAFLGIPCFIVRDNTEHTFALVGNNKLIGTTTESILESFFNGLKYKKNPIQDLLWDGKASNRIINILLQ